MSKSHYALKIKTPFNMWFLSFPNYPILFLFTFYNFFWKLFIQLNLPCISLVAFFRVEDGVD